MKKVLSGRVAAVSVACAVAVSSGCGYFLHPERVGQTEGRIDPAIVALDAASLLFGIIPGVIAFAVDLSTGAIYLPPGEENVLEKHQKRSSLNLLTQPIDAKHVNIDHQAIARKLSLATGRPINAEAIQYHQATDRAKKIRLELMQSGDGKL